MCRFRSETSEAKVDICAGSRRKLGVVFALTILCAVLIWNIVYFGIVLLTDNNAPFCSESSNLSVLDQNQHLILNDLHMDSSQGTGGVMTISLEEVGAADVFIISSFFIYFMIATNVQDYNLFPSQATLNQSTRKKIYKIIEENEGIHLREICRLLDKKMGVCQYHIYALEKANLISSMKDGRYKRFFVNHKGAPEERQLISLLRRESTAKILILIYEHNSKGISHSAIAKELDSTSQAVTWHIHKLDDAGIILINRQGCQKFYQINPDYLPTLENLLPQYS